MGVDYGVTVNQTGIDKITTKSAKQALDRRLRKSIELMIAVREHGAEHVERVHHLRTETRRADAALRLLGDGLPHHRAKSIRRQLNDLRDQAGQVRDLDVIRPLLEEYVPQLPSATGEWLKERMRLLRAKKKRSLRQGCRKLLANGFEDEAKSTIRQLYRKKSTDDATIQQDLLQAVNPLLTKFFGTINLLSLDPQQFHQARILGRRLRYTIDLLGEIFPAARLETAGQQLTKLQDALGLVHDQQSLLQFLKTSLSDCDDQTCATSLLPLIQAVETTSEQQRIVAIQSMIEQVQEIRNLRTILTSQISGT